MRLLSLAPPFRGSPHAGGGREGGRRGRRQGGRQEGGRREGMPAGTYLLPGGLLLCTPPPELQDRCAVAGPPPAQTDVPAAAGRAPGVGNAMGLLPQVRGIQGPLQGTGHPCHRHLPQGLPGGAAPPRHPQASTTGVGSPTAKPVPTRAECVVKII